MTNHAEIAQREREESRYRRQLARQQRTEFLTESAELNSYYAKSAASRARYHEKKAKSTCNFTR